MKRIKSYLKTNFKGIMIGIVIGVLLCGTIGVCAATYFESNLVTYDNTESGLNSTDVQGAIDELYNACKTPAGPLDGTPFEDVPIVTVGDGLYADEYEIGRYIYKGGNPNNYITFNNEDAGWRIISVEPDKTIKIMRIASIGDIVWDTSGRNNWARPSSLNTYLNDTYYNSLNVIAKNQMVANNFSISAITVDNNNMSTQVSDENSILWKGKIALPTVSEYIRTNRDKSRCGTLSLINNYNNYSSCLSTGWMDNNDNWWTLTPYYNGSNSTYGVISDGCVQDYGYVNYTTSGVCPALYLSSEVKIIGGDGTQNNPYIIE